MSNDADGVRMLVDESRITELLTRCLRAIDRGDFHARRITDDLPRAGGEWGMTGRRGRFDRSKELGPRSATWLGGRLDRAQLPRNATYPDDPIYDQPGAVDVGARSAS